jgi:hypothetical protein
MTNSEIGQIWQDVKANRIKRQACPRHTIAPNSYTFGRKVTCLNCEATIQATEYMAYVEGYVAAGGEANDVWPGWEK